MYNKYSLTLWPLQAFQLLAVLNLEGAGSGQEQAVKSALPFDTYLLELISSIQVIVSVQPVQYKLTSKLARLLGLHTAKRPDIINAVWQYINVGA